MLTRGTCRKDYDLALTILELVANQSFQNLSWAVCMSLSFTVYVDV